MIKIRTFYNKCGKRYILNIMESLSNFESPNKMITKKKKIIK